MTFYLMKLEPRNRNKKRFIFTTSPDNTHAYVLKNRLYNASVKIVGIHLRVIFLSVNFVERNSIMSFSINTGNNNMDRNF